MKRILTAGSGLLISIPTLGRPVPLRWAWAFKSLNAPINYNTNFMQVEGKPVDEARNDSAREALRLDCKYLFFLGDDVEVPPHTLKQLIFRMENNPQAGVVGGVYCSKSNPPAPLVFTENGKGSYWDWKIGEFFECTGLGMDCTLIRTEVFKQLSAPWFKTVDEDEFVDGINRADQWTEDLFFLKRVIEETEFKVYCDTSILCTHWDVYAGKGYTLPQGSLPLRKLSVSADKKKALDLGCGPIDRSAEFPDFNLVRVDIREDCNPDYRCDVSLLPFANEEFDLVFSSHVLEHFPRDKWEGVLNEWCRLVKKGGEIMLMLPNIAWATGQLYLNPNPDNDTLNVLYGAQTNPFDYHYNGFTEPRLKEALNLRGFEIFNVEHHGYNMVTRARKE